MSSTGQFINDPIQLNEDLIEGLEAPHLKKQRTGIDKKKYFRGDSQMMMRDGKSIINRTPSFAKVSISTWTNDFYRRSGISGASSTCSRTGTLLTWLGSRCRWCAAVCREADSVRRSPGRAALHRKAENCKVRESRRARRVRSQGAARWPA